MGLLQFAGQSASRIASSSPFPFHSSRLILRPVFLRGFSASFHLVMLLSLSIAIAWSFRRRRTGRSKESLESSGFPLYKTALFTCLCLSLFNLSLCVFNLFWFMNGWRWEDEVAAAQLDLAARTLAWSAVAAYLHLDLSHSNGKRFPVFLRTWWALFLLMSSSFLAIDLLLSRRAGSFPTHLWALDVGSVLLGFFLNCAGFSGKRLEDGEACRLREPLLNGGGAGGSPEGRRCEESSPLSSAGFLSILTFSWMGPLLSKGYKKRLDLDDVPQLAAEDSVSGFLPLFESRLGAHASGGSLGGSSSRPGIGTLHLVKALTASTWRQILWTALCALVSTLCTYIGPWLIDSFVQYLNGRHRFAHQGQLLVTAFVGSELIGSLSDRHWFFKLQQIRVRVRSALAAVIYNKGLSLSNNSRQGRPAGELINLMSVDANRIGMFCWRMHDIWLVPIQITLALLILYSNLGLAFLAALAATVVVMLANVPLGSILKKFQEKMMASKDARMKTTSEVLRNMRILKLQAWEMKFLSKIVELRKEEANWLTKLLYTAAMLSFILWIAPTFVSVVTFGTCMLAGIPLESGKVLSALATFRVLQVPIYTLPDTISTLIQAKVSLDRISSFLRLQELQPDLVEKLPPTEDSSSRVVAIEVTNGTFSWDPSSGGNPTLRDLNFQVLRGMRVAVCGTVGSGKSSLLSCILGEVSKISGSVKLCGRIAYVPQSPWIQSGTIVHNILFGKAMDGGRYERVLEACALKKDLEVLPSGDKTVIGERGINLSGGQKQRIQIARALYHDADIFLFDDPFSAVDAHTGTHLFKECLLGMLSSKTVLFVTHQVEFLPTADLILVMKYGKITQSGKYVEILSSGTDFMELVSAHKKGLSSHDTVDLMSKGSTVDDVASYPETRHKEEKKDEENGKADDEIVDQTQQLVQDEEREEGRVGFSIYWRYVATAYKGALVPFIMLSQILLQALQVGSNYWMAWAAPVSKDMVPPVSGLVLICVYVALALGSSICTLITALLLVTAGYKTATLLFNKMHTCIFRAPMSFFDSTPSGRILSRASTDQSKVDTSVYYQIGTIFLSMMQLVGVIVVMSQVAWPVFIVFIPVVATCIWYQQYYIATARELARLIGVGEAPVIQHFSESLSGSTTIRAFEHESRFMGTNLHLCDAYSRPIFHNAAAMIWLCFRLDTLASLTFLFSVVILISLPRGAIDPAMAGLAVTYGLNLNMLQNMLILNLCNLENEIISVERILQYTCIPSEPPLTIEMNKPDSSWPSQGKVEIRDLQVRYAPHLPLVLRGLTCTFTGGMKIGIVGRTGSGKSTLIQALFRIVDPAVGQILIDGADISTIGLHDLRSRLSIIPQEPTMFEGTVRSNLDPIGEYTDEEIWQALDTCQLGEEVRNKEGKLDSAVNENGENWSMGQRQLVCLGRVILKKSKILVLDEATASVDTATDNLIQKTLKQLFSDSTVITIAHRITSVLDSDMVLLLDNGEILEYDSPSKLLEDRSSLFTKLVSEYTMR
uniref:ABC transporter C family member 3 n=1 Tax=Anthurium amnicola TaxID=1678845 RepID=A0A1D1YZ73_9ARAE